jgi:hypothetical protein
VLTFYPGDAWRVGLPTVLFLTAAELNNLVYAWLRFTWRIERPDEALIAGILGSVGEPTLYDELLAAVARTADRLKGEVPDASTWRVVQAHAALVFQRFSSLPFADRADLGPAGSDTRRA